MEIKSSKTLLHKKAITRNKDKCVLVEKILDTLNELKSDFNELKTLDKNAIYTNNSNFFL